MSEIHKVIDQFAAHEGPDQRLGAMAQTILDLQALLAKKKLTLEEAELISRSLALAYHMLGDEGQPNILVEDVACPWRGASFY